VVHGDQGPDGDLGPDGDPPTRRRLRQAQAGRSGPGRRVLVAGGAAAVVLVVVAGYFLLRGPAGTPTPRSAATVMLTALQANDQEAYLTVACAADVKASSSSSPKLTDDAQLDLTSFDLGATTAVDDANATVTTSITTGGTTVELRMPVVKEGDDWKVCLSGLVAEMAKEVSAPAQDGVCGGQGNALTVATYFVIDVEVRAKELAAGCVYPGALPDSLISSLLGAHLIPTETSSGPDFPYRVQESGAKVTLQTAQLEGKWWVVGLDFTQ
jgi:hypothetical protein